MSSVVEPDKENQEQQCQTVSRKAVVSESNAPRTPFADVNRLRSLGGDLADGALKPGQPSGRRSWAPECLQNRQFYATGDSHLTPLRNKAKESLRPSLPDEKGAESIAAEQLLPVVSQSCPDMLSREWPLPSIGEASPEKLGACLSPGDLPALSPECGTPAATPDLSLACEEGTPFAVHNVSGGTESDMDSSYVCEVLENQVEDISMSRSQIPVSDMSSCSVMSDEGISSEAYSPERETFIITCDSQEVTAWSPGMQAMAENQSESVDAACFVLEHILKRVEEKLTSNQQGQNEPKQNSVDLPTPHGQTFLSEYARFVESYGQENSPAIPNTTGSLTDVTPTSQDSEVQSSSSNFSCNAPSDDQLVVGDSPRSVLSDSDESFSSTSTIQRHLTFEDMRSPETDLNDSFGFVRSSESKFDLREHPGDSMNKNWGTERGDSAERDFLNLSISEQKVEFIALPPKLRSVASSPIDMQNQNQSCFSRTGSPTVHVQDAQTMTVHAETRSVPVSPFVVPVCDRSTVTDALQSPVTKPTPQITHTSNIALSPMPVSVREQEANTSVTETVDVDTMTQALPTSEVALSPMVVARREIDTMTTVTSTTETGMATEKAEYLDHSMLAMADMDSKTTMTDSTGRRNVSTTMTPFKTMVKEGRRLTSDEIRKQHPRAVANQLETLTVANSRLESQALSAKQEHKRLQGALKEANKLASSRQSELEAVEKQKEEEWKEKEREQSEKCQTLEQLSQELQNRVASLEQELSTLRADSDTAMLRHMEDLKAMQEQCHVLEETHAHSEEQHQLEELRQDLHFNPLQESKIEELKKSQETDSYRHQFERAQQMVREQEAELNEIRELFTDLQTTASKQEKIHLAYQQMHKKIITLASENRALRDSFANRTWLSREEAEHQQAEMVTLQQDKAGLVEEVQSLKNTMALHIQNQAELEKLHSASSADLLIATQRVVELNSELHAAQKAVEAAEATREGVAQHSQELEEQLYSMQETEGCLTAALQGTQAQLQQQALAHEKLQTVYQKMKKVYEDKLENMALGVENLQRTLDSREVDMNNLEKDLYECRNIILEQRYKIDGLETDLREARNAAAAKRAEEEDIEFFKKSNAFLEAERALYVQSLRDLEEKLRATSQESTQQQQVAADAEEMVEELQQDKLRLISELSHTQTQLVNASRDLSEAREEQERVESVVMASANDLLQHMQLMLAELKKKIGLQEVPEVYPADSQPPPQMPRLSKPVKSRRHSRKSFVSSILGAIPKAPDQGAAEQDSDYWESGSYLGEAMTDSVRKAISAKTSRAGDVGGSACKGSAVKEVRVTTVGTSFREQDLSRSEVTDTHSGQPASVPAGRRKLRFSNIQPLSMSWTENLASCQNASGPSPYRSAHISSASLPGSPSHSLLPPSSDFPSSAVARVRSIPRTEYHLQSSLGGSLHAGKGGERGMVGCVTSLKEVFSSISRLASILNRATQLSLQDLREENDMLRERTEILENSAERNSAELTVCREEAKAKDTAVLKLEQQCREMREQMMNLTDQKFQIRRLMKEVQRLEGQVQHERSEKEVVSAELDSRLCRLETSANDGGAAQARCVRDVIALKKKNFQLVMQLEEQRDHYEEQGAKAARRMRVLDDNWKKAEDELYRLDELVESIKQIAQQSSSPTSDLQRIVRLIEGETKSSPL